MVSVYASGSYAVFAPTSIWKMREVVNHPFFFTWLIRFRQRFTVLYDLLFIIGANDIFGCAVQHSTNFSRDVGIIDLFTSIIPLA